MIKSLFSLLFTASLLTGQVPFTPTLALNDVQVLNTDPHGQMVANYLTTNNVKAVYDLNTGVAAVCNNCEARASVFSDPFPFRDWFYIRKSPIVPWTAIGGACVFQYPWSCVPTTPDCDSSASWQVTLVVPAGEALQIYSWNDWLGWIADGLPLPPGTYQYHIGVSYVGPCGGQNYISKLYEMVNSGEGQTIVLRAFCTPCPVPVI